MYATITREHLAELGISDSAIDNFTQAILKNLSGENDNLPVMKKKERINLGIIIIGAILTTLQTLIYPDAAMKAVKSSDILGQHIDDGAFLDTLMVWAVISSSFANWLLGYATILIVGKRYFSDHLNADEVNYLIYRHLSKKQRREERTREGITIGAAATSVLPFFALGFRSNMVEGSPLWVKFPWATLLAAGLLPVHTAGMLENKEKYELLKMKRAGGEERAIILSRQAILNGIEIARQNWLRNAKENGLATPNHEAELMIQAVRNANLNDIERAAEYLKMAFKLNPEVTERLQQAQDNPNEYQMWFNDQLRRNSNGFIDNVKDYFKDNRGESDSQVDQLFSILLTVAKDLGYNTYKYVLFTASVVLSLLGYGNYAGSEFAQMVLDGAESWGLIDDASDHGIGYNIIYAVVFVLAFSPLFGLCVKSAPGVADGIANFVKSILFGAENKLDLTDIVSPKLYWAFALPTLFLCALSGAANAYVNEQFINPTEHTGLMKAIGYYLWCSAALSSTIVNLYYGFNVISAIVLWVAKRFVIDEHELKLCEHDEQIFQYLTELFTRQSMNDVKSIVTSVSEVDEELAEILTNLFLEHGKMTQEDIDNAFRRPEEQDVHFPEESSSEQSAEDKKSIWTSAATLFRSNRANGDRRNLLGDVSLNNYGSNQAQNDDEEVHQMQSRCAVM